MTLYRLHYLKSKDTWSWDSDGLILCTYMDPIQKTMSRLMWNLSDKDVGLWPNLSTQRQGWLGKDWLRLLGHRSGMDMEQG
ncbi:hypothetical protein E3N88_12231 [Mikania micrantha]|uniref:Uncharacterized protein n=1 Tax=Mikania micrantha TaxID=192012 RepID=A0A5N6P584_9ASTR|nr:hypothetical protein E3N88_12231 [Mikania micrantha]